MPLWCFVVCKSWASDRLRALLTLLGIACGVAIVVAIYVMDHNTIQTQLRRQDPTRGRVDLEVVPLQERADAEVQADLLGRAGVQTVGHWVEAKAVLQVDGRELPVVVIGLDPLRGGAFGHYHVQDGAEPAGDAAVLLGEEVARRLGVTAGQRLVFADAPPVERVRCVDGRLEITPPDRSVPRMAHEVAVAGVLSRTGLGRHNFGELVVAPYALAARLQSAGASAWQIRRSEGADFDRLRRELARDYRVIDARAVLIGEQADERAFRNGLKVLGCLALLLGMFGVFQTLAHTLVARVRMLGLLRALGLSGRGAAMVFVGDALALGVVGSALGIGGGVLLALLMRRLEMSSLGLMKPWATFEVPLVPVLWTAALGVLFTFAGALFPLLRARRMPALQILQAPGLTRSGDSGDLLRGVHVWLFVLLVVALPVAYLAMTPLVAQEGIETLIVLAELGAMLIAIAALLIAAPVLVVLGGKLLLVPLRLFAPLCAFLADKAIARGRGRLAASVCGLAAALAAVIGNRSLISSLDGEVGQFAAQALRDRVFVEMPAITRTEGEAVAALPGVAAVEWIEGEVRQGFLLRGVAPQVLGAPTGALAQDGAVLEQYGDPRLRGLVASTRLARQLGWRVGSLVALVDRNQEPVAYRVLAISDRSGYAPDERSWAIAAPGWLRRDFCVPERCIAQATLHVAPGADAGTVLERAKAVVPDADRRLKTGAWIEAYHRRDITRDFAMFDFLLVLILALVAVGLLNGMTIAALGRVREFGVQRALGISRRTQVRVVLIEGVLVGLLAAGLALAMAPGLAALLVGGLNHVAGLDAPVVLPERWLWAMPLVGAVTGLLAALLPGWRVGRIAVARALRYE